MSRISYIFHFVLYLRVCLFVEKEDLLVPENYVLHLYPHLYTLCGLLSFLPVCSCECVCVCVCVCACGLSATGSGCPCLLVMDTNGPGQASTEQGGRFVCVTPSCCPRPGRGEGRRGGRPLWGSGSPSACITLNINTHCSAALRGGGGNTHTHTHTRRG